MTVTPRKSSPEPSSSSCIDTSPRSDPAQMDEVDGLRSKPSTDDSLSLAPSAAEPINLEDYAPLRAELDSDAQNLEAESWSVSVDPDCVKALHKEAVRRQDVIYELIQTEMHHVRTLKILKHIYMHELRQSQQIDDAKLEGLFPGVDALLTLHQHFLNSLKMRQRQSQEQGSPTNYQITQLGDILISQFSGQLGEKMADWYGVFCSRHTDCVSFYKEQLQSNKKLQSLINKIRQLPLVRRLGIPECFLLVTQRITKYPVLVERLIQNTDADTDEHKSLQEGLTLIRDTISQVDSHVNDYEKAARLRAIYMRLEPKSQGRLKDGQVFRREDLTQGNRILLHEGPVSWKSSGKYKEIHAVLLSDVLLLLQEKDQKLVFAAVQLARATFCNMELNNSPELHSWKTVGARSLLMSNTDAPVDSRLMQDNKPPVISLQRLLVREMAHDVRALFLICASTSTALEMYEMYEMYELYIGTREERTTWAALIQEAVNNYSEEAEINDELTVKLQEYQGFLKVRDDYIRQCLMEKLQIFATMYEESTGQKTPHRVLLLRGDATELQQGETLLKGAIDEVENLQNMLLSRIKEPVQRSETPGSADSPLAANTMKNGDAAEGPAGIEGTLMCAADIVDDQQLQEFNYYESQEESADDTEMPNRSSTPSNFNDAEVCDRLILLAQRLYSLQAIIVQQDSQIELQHTLQAQNKPSRPYSSVLLEQEKQRNAEKRKEELANLQKLQAQHRESQQRWEKERDRQSVQMESLEAELRLREEDCKTREEKLNEEKAELQRQKEDYQQDLERLRESTRAVEKENERLTQEKERLEQQQEKLKKYMSMVNPALSNYDDPANYSSLSSYQSFRGSIINGVTALTPKPKPLVLPSATSDPSDVPPRVPPRRESISPLPAKPELPIHLISTTNQVHRPPPMQQQIPTKLASQAKGKEKGFKMKGSHQRTHSAASIDVNQVLPIRVSGREGGSLQARRPTARPTINQSDTFVPPESVRNMKTSQSFIAHKRSHTEERPPPPPPFPKEILEKSKEKVIFL